MMTVTLFEYYLLKFSSLMGGYVLVFGLFFPCFMAVFSHKKPVWKTMLLALYDVLIDILFWIAGAYVSYVVVSAYTLFVAGGMESPPPKLLFFDELKYLSSRDFSFFVGAGFVCMTFRLLWRFIMVDTFDIFGLAAIDKWGEEYGKISKFLLACNVPVGIVKKYRKGMAIYYSTLLSGIVLVLTLVLSVDDSKFIGWLSVILVVIIGGEIIHLWSVRHLGLRYKT